MNPFRKLNRLDLTAGATLLLLSVLIVGVIFYRNWLGVSVTLQTANPLGEISPYETLILNFSQPVQANDAENQLQLQPSTAGKLEWQDDRTAWFIPTEPFQGQLTARLVPGPLGADGTWLRREVSWQMTVRQPRIVYLNYGEPQNELLSVAAEGGAPIQLTSTGGRVFDFSVSLAGDEIAYSVMNEQQGIDLWVVQRNGANPRKALDCGAGRCTNPAWSADGRLLAYNLEAAGITPNSSPGAPRPRIFDLSTGENRPVFSDPQTIGSGISWSPDGNWLASYDGIGSLIRVVNLKSGQQVTLSSNYGTTGAWSPDSRYFLYANVVSGINNLPKTILYRADFQTGETGIFLGQASDDEVDYAYRLPAWSPTGSKIAIAMRVDPGKPAQQIWLISPDILSGPVIAREPNYGYDFYQWDPWGTRLVIQQVKLGTTYYPEIAVWHSQQGLRVVAGNAMFPAWLP
jgi:Tol biopolymer transport system component